MILKVRSSQVEWSQTINEDYNLKNKFLFLKQIVFEFMKKMGNSGLEPLTFSL